MKKEGHVRITAVIFLCALMCASCSRNLEVFGVNFLGEPTKEKYDVRVEAVPIRVKAIEPDSVVDAIEAGSEGMVDPQAIILFKIDRVLEGRFTQLQTGGPSRLEQAKEATRRRRFFQLLTLDFEDPDEETEKQWISIAVRDPLKSFGIESWENPEKNKYEIYLRRLSAQADSYIAVKAQRKKKVLSSESLTYFRPQTNLFRQGGEGAA